MSTAKKIPLIPILLGLAVLCMAGAGYRWYSQREEGRAGVAAVVIPLQKAKAEMLEAYKARIVSLENWNEILVKSSKKPVPELALSENIKQAKDLKFENQAEADRYDFVQNQISEKISQYIAKDPNSASMREIQKIEENINRKRKDYHKAAFEIEDINRRYHLKDVKPIVFGAELALKDKGLL